MIAVLSPAKTLDFDSPIAPHSFSECALIDDAEYLAAKCQKLSAAQIGKLMSINTDLAATNYHRFQRWQRPFPEGEKRHALLAFQGDVYRGLKATKWSPKDIAFSQDHLRILSGLYGILRPLDAILPYRLEMGSRLKVTATKTNLYKYWGSRIQETLLTDLGDEPLINLASNEYFKGLVPKTLPNRVITCHFRQFKDGAYKPLMTYAKHGRGYMARFMAQNHITKAEDLKGFDQKGYAFNTSLSSTDDWVFTRDIVEL